MLGLPSRHEVRNSTLIPNISPQKQQQHKTLATKQFLRCFVFKNTKICSMPLDIENNKTQSYQHLIFFSERKKLKNSMTVKGPLYFHVHLSICSLSRLSSFNDVRTKQIRLQTSVHAESISLLLGKSCHKVR